LHVKWNHSFDNEVWNNVGEKYNTRSWECEKKKFEEKSDKSSEYFWKFMYKGKFMVMALEANQGRGCFVQECHGRHST
jgi:hypothetical protein